MKQQTTLKPYSKRNLLDLKLYENMHERLQKLGKQINLFLQSVERSHVSEK